LRIGVLGIHSFISFLKYLASFAWSFRRENDTVWGIWNPSENATKIWNDVTKFTQTYGYNFDLIYNGTLTYFTWKNHYNKLIS